jgi:hypothetical protein
MVTETNFMETVVAWGALHQWQHYEAESTKVLYRLQKKEDTMDGSSFAVRGDEQL